MLTLDLDTAIRLATIELCSKEEAKSTPKIHAVQPEEEDDGVEAVTQNQLYSTKKFTQQNQQNQAPQNCQNFCPQNTYRGNQNQSSWRNNNPGNNSNRNKMTYIFCRKQGHRQEDCRKTINANQPCPDFNGKALWPKINITDKVLQSRHSRTRIFNSELDGTPTSSSRCHFCNYYEFVCCFNHDFLK
jgi:hypothetical protein